MKKKNKVEELEPEYIILDEQARVFTGLKGGYPEFLDDVNEAKPLRGQGKFDFMQRYHPYKIEQMFLENTNVREKRKHRKTKISV
jgi:hypothetical protein